MPSLADEIQACVRCPLNEVQEPGAKHVPGSVGSKYQKGGVALIADAPGYYDAKSGLPFQGRPGTSLDELLALVPISRDELFVTYNVRCRAPNGRLQDHPEALFHCAYWTEREFEEYDPAVVIAMGRESLKLIYGTEASVINTRGFVNATPAKHGWGHRLVMATYNPGAASFAGGAQLGAGAVHHQGFAGRAERSVVDTEGSWYRHRRHWRSGLSTISARLPLLRGAEGIR
jgi:uracil-DNA glycosylase family 4